MARSRRASRMPYIPVPRTQRSDGWTPESTRFGPRYALAAWSIMGAD